MSVLADTAGKFYARAKTRPVGYRVEFVADLKQAAIGCDTFSPPTPFQHPQWSEAWYSAFAGAEGIEALIALVSEAATGELAMVLPLIRRRQNGIAVVEFADLDLTDYNAPLLGPAAPRDARAARALWRDLLSALRNIPGG